MTRPVGALVATLVASVLVLAGCASIDEAQGNADAAAAGSAQGQGRPPTPAEELLSVEAAPGAPLKLTQPEVAFLAKVKVPPGIYEGAVLESGYEACLRIGETAAVDEDALRSALDDGEIPKAEAAISTLCPEFERFLPAR